LVLALPFSAAPASKRWCSWKHNAFPEIKIPGGGPQPNVNFTSETNVGGRIALTCTIEGELRRRTAAPVQ
jgi:hypothetical protein